MADLGFAQFWGGIGIGTISSIFVYAFWGIVLALVAGIAYKIYTDKKIYKNPVRVWRLRANGQTKEFNTRGGYIINKKKITEFYIKLGRFKKRKMGELPNPDLIDNEDRVYYFQISPTEYIQTKAQIIYEPKYIPNPNFKEPTEEEKKEIIRKWGLQLREQNKDLIEEEAEVKAEEIYYNWVEENRGKWLDVGTLQIRPQNQASKESVINDVILTKQLLGIDVNKQFLYFVGGVIALVVLGIVIFYIATNGGKLPILEFAPLMFLKWRKKPKKK